MQAPFRVHMQQCQAAGAQLPALGGILEKSSPRCTLFHLGHSKSTSCTNRWIPVWVCHVEKMVAPFQRKEGTAAVGDLLPKRSWEKTESIFTQHPTLPGRVLGV